MLKYLETIKALDGEIFNIDYHQKRYNGSKNLKDFLHPPKDGLYKCSIVYDESDNIDVNYQQYTKREIHSLKLIDDDNISYDKKFANREDINNLFEKRDGCDDILIVKNSLITDTSIANIAFLKKGIWYTPKKPLLKGTTRARLLDEDFLKEVDIRVKDLKEFEKVALLNAMIGFDIISNLKIKGIKFVREFNTG
jgi:4-amino-4-deoxychorismate lyase